MQTDKQNDTQPTFDDKPQLTKQDLNKAQDFKRDQTNDNVNPIREVKTGNEDKSFGERFTDTVKGGLEMVKDTVTSGLEIAKDLLGIKDDKNEEKDEDNDKDDVLDEQKKQFKEGKAVGFEEWMKDKENKKEKIDKSDQKEIGTESTEHKFDDFIKEGISQYPKVGDKKHDRDERANLKSHENVYIGKQTTENLDLRANKGDDLL